MHRLNKRVAVLSDVVEHDGGEGARPRRGPQNNYWQAANSQRRSRPVRTSKLMYALPLHPPLIFFQRSRTRHIASRTITIMRLSPVS